MVKDIETGTRFGRLTVIGRAPQDPTRKSRSAWWFCRCDCGAEKKFQARNLRGGLSRSCGCFQKDRAVETHTSHGCTGTKEYRAWNDMRQRCDNPNRKNYKDYGGRGIGYDPSWATFETFLADMGKCPEDKHSIDRKNNEKGYSKDNCCWATHEEQQNNTLFNRHFTHPITGKTQSASGWAREMKMTVAAFLGRIDILGWSVEEALLTPRIPTAKELRREAWAAANPELAKGKDTK